MKPSRTLPLLVEIGCEEIPARFLASAEHAFAEGLEKGCREASLVADSGPTVRSYSTPRRLVAWIPALLEKQPDKVEEILGPPVRVGLDAEGKPTRAAESFAQKNRAKARDLVRVTTARGEYLALQKTVGGRAARELLPGIITDAVTGMSFPKSMYWVAKSGPRFARPIRWTLALLGEGKGASVVPVEFCGVRSSNVTFGHRVVGGQPISLWGFEDYAKKLRQARVEFDPGRRRERIQEELKVLLEDFRLTAVQDRALEDWTVNSTEWPRAIAGEFDARFLSLPREILITVMREHQKYFAVQDRKGNLVPRFLAVLNLDGDPKGTIRSGHERVLAARFTDAEFFWNADQRVPLRARQETLARVTYQAELGSYAEKVRRMAVIASGLCQSLREAGKLSEPEAGLAIQAIGLAKCDLTTQMVQELPELQGVVGGLYARAQGEPAEVADAIYDHYLPQGLEDRCPRTLIGAVVSLADKIDSVVAGFAVGREPSGSRDPFALRRQANGMVKVLVELALPLSTRQFVMHAVNALNIRMERPHSEIFETVLRFLEERLRYYFESAKKLRYDAVRAVLAAGWDVPADALRRAEALEAIRGGENFAALSAAAKRIKNILAKSATAADWQPGEIDSSVLEPGEERALFDAYADVASRAASRREAGDYRAALETIATLRPTVDKFFDKVLVMAPDPAVRQNRLRLLGKLDELFSGIAHFAEIAAPPADVDASTSRH